MIVGHFSFLFMIPNRIQYTDVMLKIPTSCGCFADNENHGHDVDADVLLIGFADVHNPQTLFICMLMYSLFMSPP